MEQNSISNVEELFPSLTLQTGEKQKNITLQNRSPQRDSNNNNNNASSPPRNNNNNNNNNNNKKKKQNKTPQKEEQKAIPSKKIGTHSG